jgi:hypothetical protein
MLKINKAWKAIGSLCVDDYDGLLEAAKLSGSMLTLFLDVAPLIGGEAYFFGWGDGMDLDAPAGQNGEAAPDGHGAVAAETVEVAVALSQLGQPRGDGNDNRADDEDTGDLYNFDNRPFVENGNADDGGDNDDAYDDGGNENNFGSEGEERKEGDIGHAPMRTKKVRPVDHGNDNRADDEDTGDLHNFDNRPFVENGNADDGGDNDDAHDDGGNDDAHDDGGNENNFGSEGEERKEGDIGHVPMTSPEAEDTTEDNEIDNGSEGEERKEGGIGPVPMTAPGHTRRKHKKVSPVEKIKNRATHDRKLHVRERKRKHIAAMRALQRLNADFPLLL